MLIHQRRSAFLARGADRPKPVAQNAATSNRNPPDCGPTFGANDSPLSVGKRPRWPVVAVTSLERSPTMIQRQGLTLWWQYLELLALLTLSPFALRYRPLLAELGGPRTHSLR